MIVGFHLSTRKTPFSESASPSSRHLAAKSLVSTDFDFLGAATLAASIACVLVILEIGGKLYPWSHPIPVALCVVLLVATILFVLTELRFAQKPVVPLERLKERNVGMTITCNAFIMASYTMVGA